MKWRRGFWLQAAVVAFIIGLFPPASGFAAETPSSGISLQISPLPIELVGQPGSSVGADLRVRNAGSQTEELQVHILKVTEDDNGEVHFSEPKQSDEWAGWIHFSRTIFDAPPNDWQTIQMNINLPKDAAFGYYFAVEYTRATAEAPQPGQAVARGAVATFILLEANNPGAKRQAEVVSFTASHKLYEYLPVSFSTKIRASGNLHVAPHGNIFISKGGKQVGTIEINSAEGSVLPNSSRFFSAAWDDGFPHFVPRTKDGNPVVDKKGRPKQSLKWDLSKAGRLRIGQYTAHLYMVYDNGQRDVPIEATLKFWVLPWKLLLLAAAIAALILVGLLSSLRRLSRFAKTKAGR